MKEVEKQAPRLGRALAVAGIIFGAALTFAACSGSDNPVAYNPLNNTTNSQKTSLTVYAPSSDYSAYMTQTLKNFNVQTATNVGSADLFIVNGSDIDSLTQAQLTQIIQICLNGKTLVIDKPSTQKLMALGTKLDSVLALEENKTLKAQSKLADETPHHIVYKLISALSDDETETNPFTQSANFIKEHEAIGLRKAHIYYVHDIPNDEQTYLEQSAQNFAKWISKKDEPTSASKLIDAKVQAKLFGDTAPTKSSLSDLLEAQTFTHNFINTNVGGETTLKQNVEVSIDVWEFCNIDTQEDYYIVKTSVICHNGSIQTNDPTLYWRSCQIASTMTDDDKQTLLPDNCSPHTSTGSTTFTTGTNITNTTGGSFAIGTTTGWSGSGAALTATFTGTRSWSTGETIVKTSTTSIPDINITFDSPKWSNKGPWWYFEAPWANKASDLKGIQKSDATFDTFAVYKLNSSAGLSDGKVELHTIVFPACNTFKGAWVGLNLRFDDHVIKPNNAKREYIMSFTPPDGTSMQQKDELHNIVKIYISNWNDNLTYYAIGESRLDDVAASCFDLAMEKITTNKNVLKDRGFSGKNTFYIQNVENGNKVKTLEIEF